MVSRVIPVDPFDLVIFGGSGDLAKRKILPGLFRRFVSGQMPPNAQIIGAARSEFDQEQYRALIKEAVCVFGNIDETHPELTAFLNRLSYVQIDARGEGGWTELRDRMRPDIVRAF